MIDKIVTHCNTCELYKKNLYHNQPQDLVKAKNFNHTVSMDLRQLGEKLWYLHFTDEFSRFSNATIIKRI